MPSIVFRDTTGSYDGTSLATKPLGGTESSVVYLSEALAGRGHNITVYSSCERAIVHNGVAWRPLGDPPPRRCDLYVAVQHVGLLGFVPRPRRRVIWVVWQPNHLKHYKRLPWMWWYRPIPLLASLHQAHIYSQVLPRRDPHLIIPFGLPDDIRGMVPLDQPLGPEAIFISNPQRNLKRLVEIWAQHIWPQRPDAVLNVYGIRQVPAGVDPWDIWAGSVLPVGLAPEVKASVRIHPTLPRAELITALRRSRAMLYLGHKVEAFCLALAEAQALGVPAVVAPVTVLPERVIDGVTGFVRADPEAFAQAALALLNDDELWRRQHLASLRYQQGLSWDDCAARFENALLSDWIDTNRAEALAPDLLPPRFTDT